MTRLAVFLATVAYCGYFPIAPGTVGSAAGLVVYLLVWWTRSPILEVGLIALTFAAGTWAATRAERFFGGIDHRDPDAVLDAAPGVEVLQFGDYVGHGALGYLAQPDQRRISD